MRRNKYLAGLLSFLVPGLGQMYCGRGKKGASILAATIIIGNLNLIFIPVFISANPNPEIIWEYWIPRVGHDVMSFWSIIFWLWAIFDAYKSATEEALMQT